MTITTRFDIGQEVWGVFSDGIEKLTIEEIRIGNEYLVYEFAEFLYLSLEEKDIYSSRQDAETAKEKRT